MNIPGPWEEDTKLTIDIANIGLFTLQGHVYNMDGSPQAWEPVYARGSDQKEMAAVVTHSTGHFIFRSNQQISSLQTSVDRRSIVKNGPWSTDQQVTLKLSQEQTFTITGTVTDPEGNPIKDVHISARGEDGAVFLATTSRQDGAFELICDRTTAIITAYRPGQSLDHDGPWSETSEVSLVFPDDIRFIIKGHITDADGQPLVKAVVEAGQGIMSEARTRTDESGYYEFELLKPVDVLVVSTYDANYTRDKEMVVDGPFNTVATVDIIFYPTE